MLIFQVTFTTNMNRILLIGFVIFLGCKKQVQEDLFTRGESVGTVSKRLEEASGLVASVNNAGFYWTHNDGRHPAEVFLIDQKAKIRLVCKFEHLQNRDWEAIAIGTGPEEGKTYIYVGEIGDNKAQYPLKFIYRFEEPLLDDQEEIIIFDYDTLIIKLPDGVRDSEALTIDPVSNDLFLFSKREDSIRLYQLRHPFLRDTIIAERIAVLPFHNINSANISADGNEVLAKDYDHIYYWKKEGDESVGEILRKKPIELPYEKGPQDEAIAWERDGSGFFTLGETVKGEGGNLVFHKRKSIYD